VITGHEAVVELLLVNDCVDPDCKDLDGETPLLRAARCRHWAVVELLLTTDGVDADCKDTTGQTPLSLAEDWGAGSMVQLLLARTSPTHTAVTRDG
jgi:ankyrin repeat protein